MSEANSKRIHDGNLLGPTGCPRERSDCSPLSRVSSPGFASFMCCGETDTAPVPTDRLRLCIFSSHDNSPVNLMVNLDERDATDTAFVLLGGLSAFATDRANAPPEKASVSGSGSEERR